MLWHWHDTCFKSSHPLLWCPVPKKMELWRSTWVNLIIIILTLILEAVGQYWSSLHYPKVFGDMEVSTLDQTEHFENELIERTLLIKSKPYFTNLRLISGECMLCTINYFEPNSCFYFWFLTKKYESTICSSNGFI